MPPRMTDNSEMRPAALFRCPSGRTACCLTPRANLRTRLRHGRRKGREGPASAICQYSDLSRPFDLSIGFSTSVSVLSLSSSLIPIFPQPLIPGVTVSHFSTLSLRPSSIFHPFSLVPSPAGSTCPFEPATLRFPPLSFPLLPSSTPWLLPPSLTPLFPSHSLLHGLPAHFNSCHPPLPSSSQPRLISVGLLCHGSRVRKTGLEQET